MAMISTDTAEHYPWGEASDGWHLLRDPNLSVLEEHMPPGAAELRHRHSRARHFVYVLAGEVMLQLDGEQHVLRAGQSLHVPPGSTHQMHNLSDEQARFLVISTPFGRSEATPDKEAG
ncbi:cupin domain-containing protein [Xanthomonas floridensis]|uniref:Cupin n=1 Tax=Xanthomonas floridensis TaxID=1843580 RepID=A0A1A9M671_9XANT|nr:cupin domain-containing protein [Xanthomonas floridensis]MEA5125656.1 cupin domain-containing protein [Xanthomonas floridensis]MEA5133531.1 cupin domain-containing protein [Xanthomonas floridensis]OAG65825.1 cupin [Xanthomonas floridensis]